jgi:predicted amidohydrolase YtcJ
MPGSAPAGQGRRHDKPGKFTERHYIRADVEEPATLYTGGRVLVLDGVTPRAEALVVRDGRVAGVGIADDMARLAGPRARRVALRGATVMPGLIDTHPHLLHFGAFTEPLVDLSDARDHDDIVARLARRAAETPAGEWIMATPVGEPHYFLRRSWRDLAERRLPDRHVLDRATRNHPVFIQAWAPVIPNVCALNSAGLAALGLGRDTPERVENVWIEKDARGEPTGLLSGSVNNYYTNDPFMNGLLRQVPLLQPAAVLPGTRRAMAAYNRLGVTATARCRRRSATRASGRAADAEFGRGPASHSAVNAPRESISRRQRTSADAEVTASRPRRAAAAGEPRRTQSRPDAIPRAR